MMTIMYEPIESWATRPHAETALLPVGGGLALAAVDTPHGWAFAWLFDGVPLVWPNPYTAGSVALS
jgi:hypothetical protein